MARLRLKASMWRPMVDGRFVTYREGDEFDVPDDRAEWLIGSGAAVPAGDAGPAVEVEPATPPAPAVDAVEDTPAGGRRLPVGVSRPRNAGRIELWEDYAAALGVDVKGLSKREIIAKVG